MHRLLDAHLQRVAWDKARQPVRLHPFVMADATDAEMPIADRSAHLVRSAGRREPRCFDAGESSKDVADDYDLTLEDVEGAVVYERAA
jgi:hypothetical protein